MFDTSLQDLRPPILVIFFKFFIYLIIVISDFTVERSNYGGTGGQKRQTPVPPKNMSRIIFPLNSWLLLLDCWKVLIIFQINVQRIYLLPKTTYSAWGGRESSTSLDPLRDLPLVVESSSWGDPWRWELYSQEWLWDVGDGLCLYVTTVQAL